MPLTLFVELPVFLVPLQGSPVPSGFWYFLSWCCWGVGQKMIGAGWAPKEGGKSSVRHLCPGDWGYLLGMLMGGRAPLPWGLGYLLGILMRG